MRKITVKIGIDGTAVVEAHGFKGKGCKDATKQIEEAIGASSKFQKKQPDYDAATTNSQAQQT